MGQRPAMRKFITTRDYRLMRRLNRWTPPRWFRLWMMAATRLGDGWVYVLGFVLLVLYGGPEWRDTFLACFLAGSLSGALFVLVKRKIGRVRPCEIEPHSWAHLLPPDQFSFPSGHTMFAFSIAIPLGLAYPALWPALLFLGFSIGASRVVLGMHFLSDVVVGMLLGAAIGGAAFSWVFSR